MLKELYEKIVSDAKEAVAPRIIDIPGGKVLLTVEGSAPEIIEKDDVLHSDVVSSMGSMLEWCSVYEETELYIKVQKDRVSVDANRSRAHLTQKLQFKLEFTRAFSDLSAWVERPRSQQQVVAALRTALSGTFDDPMLPIFRRLDFQRKNDGSRSVNHTGESLGKSVEARAQTASGEIPEILVFSTPVYSNVASAPCVLRFALDVDANQELIKIAPVGDCIPSAFAEAQSELAADIKQKLPNALVVCCN